MCVCVCVCVLVKVLHASIMYLDNAAASLYQQLTGIPTHRGRQRMRGKTERERTHEVAKRGKMRKENVSDTK